MSRLPATLKVLQGEEGVSRAPLQRTLEAIRTHLGMDVAYVSEFSGENSLFRAVDAPGLEGTIKPGDSQPLDDIFCRHILAGRLPEVMPDVSKEPLAMSLPIMQRVPIASHLSVPIRLEDGEAYGMFCCLSFKPDPSLNERDLQVMRVFADMAAQDIAADRKEKRAQDAVATRIRDTLARESFRPVFQPIFDLGARQVVGFEALCRFEGEPYRTPDVWFKEAAACDLGIGLEIATIRKAIRMAEGFPRDLYLSINASPELLVSGQLPALLAGVAKRRILVEVTEHAPVADYAVMGRALNLLRARGCEIAVDDAGAGYSSLQHIVQLKPDVIKLDIGLIRGVDADPSRRALISALLYFARETGAGIIAEGIETEAEAEHLRVLGINKGQGYLLSRPLEVDAAQAFVSRRKRTAA
jgi:EAL domain-containing protein (putative c-di-GMP-specific phosphodiesterase class I)